MKASTLDHRQRFGPVAALSFVLTIVACIAAAAQQPRVTTLFPIGGRAGTTVDVEIRGAALQNADKLLIQGGGMVGAIDAGGARVDETYKPLWQAKCQSCHELRSPANRSMSPAQWAATVDRMVKVRQAPLSDDEAKKVAAYLTGAARAGRVTAQIQIPSGTLPGIYEVRVATPNGLSPARLFEVGTLPETIATANSLEQPQQITLPCVANGTLAGNGERDCFRFAATQGQRYVFDLKGWRYSDETQSFFNPDLRLHDSTGREIMENHGYYDLDPLIDWTCPQAGNYTLEARDLLGRGNPGSVYRLRMGLLPYDTTLYPPAGQVDSQMDVALNGTNLSGTSSPFHLKVGDHPGLSTISTPWGPQAFYASADPLVKAMDPARVIALPAGFEGKITSASQTDSFAVAGSGRWEFRAYSSELGSHAAVQCVLKNDQGKNVAAMRDAIMTANLRDGKPYRLEVTEANGPVQGQCVYVVSARSIDHALTCIARPASLFLKPGSSTVVELQLTRREAVHGDVVIRASDLPPGVTATETHIPPDRDRGWMILTAAPDAALTDKPVQIVASADTDRGSMTTRCIPQDEYQLENQTRDVERSDWILGLRGQPDFQSSIEPDHALRVDSRKGVEVRVHIKRRASYKEAVAAKIEGLPQGWTADPITIPADREEGTLLVRPDGADRRPFLKRDPMLTPIVAVALVVADDVPYVAGTLTIDPPVANGKEDGE